MFDKVKGFFGFKKELDDKTLARMFIPPESSGYDYHVNGKKDLSHHYGDKGFIVYNNDTLIENLDNFNFFPKTKGAIKITHHHEGADQWGNRIYFDEVSRIIDENEESSYNCSNEYLSVPHYYGKCDCKEYYKKFVEVVKKQK